MPSVVPDLSIGWPSPGKSPAYLRAAQVGHIAALAGSALSVALASIQIALPLVVSGGLFVALGLFLAATMPERGFTPTPRREAPLAGHPRHHPRCLQEDTPRPTACGGPCR